MTTAPQRVPAGPSYALDELTGSSLQLIADSVTALVGFGISTISIARPDGNLHMAAVSGSDAAREQLSRTSTPIATLYAELSRADDWGLFKFVPAERLDPAEVAGWVPDIEPTEGPDGWHPLDLLVAPLRDEAGHLLGTLSIDLPSDGRRPDPEKRKLLNRYAEQSARAIVTALERELLAEQVRLAEDARAVVRQATRHADPAAALAELAESLVATFDIADLVVRLRNSGGRRASTVHRGSLPADDGLVRIGAEVAVRLWREQAVGVVGLTQRRNVRDEKAAARLEAFLRANDYGSALYGPIGAGQSCLGVLMLLRRQDQPLWTDTECDTVLDIGRDLGRLLENADALRRERETARELRALDAYKSRLISTVSHELKNPLTAILGNLEILSEDDLPEDASDRAFGALDRSTRVMERLIDDLLTLSAVGDPEPPQDPRPVDVGALVRDACGLVSATAGQRDLDVTVKAPLEPLRAVGDAAQLDRVVVNLLSNALKYTPEGGTVTATVRGVPEGIELAVSDNGIGISADDQARVFTEFFRSSDPTVAAQPGTGLGLAIVDRIVRRHGGTIAIESELGRGTTVRVLLPEAS